MNTRIAPSILSADFFHLGADVQSVLDGGADWLHIDVMDGRFVPNITMGSMVVKALRPRISLPLDVHLMIVEPERHIADFVQAGADSISIHAEATPHVHRALQQIREGGVQAGLALNPATGLDILHHLTSDIDFLLLMTVNPGFGGQPFITTMLPKIAAARAILDEHGLSHVPIQVDGGISTKTIGSVVDAGASICVAGSAVFSQSDRAAAIAALRQAAR